jgi:phosphatidylglycerophosphatase A
VATLTPWHFISAGFGAGLAPRAPGTAGSLLGLFLGALLLAAGHLPLAFAIVVVAGLGIFAIGQVDTAGQDPGWIVIDEIAGQMIPLLALSHVSFWGLAFSFGLFRLFDIWKPGPVAWADSHHNEYGVMGDDLIAGSLALLAILALRTVWAL